MIVMIFTIPISITAIIITIQKTTIAIIIMMMNK